MQNFENEHFPIVFAILTFTFLYFNYIFIIRIKTFLTRHSRFNDKIIHARDIFKNAQEYRSIKIEEENQPGKAFYAFYITFILTILFFIPTIVSLFF